MFNDLRIFIDDERKEYEYTLDKEKIVIEIKLDSNNNLRIFYDENVYEDIIINTEYQKESNSVIISNITNINKLIIKVGINEKYLVKTVFKYNNGYTNVLALLRELNIFKTIKKQYQPEIDSLINELKKDSVNKIDEIRNVLLNFDLYKKISEKMNELDLLLLITSYIKNTNVPKISQELFNKMIDVAVDYDYPKESIWRLAMSYDNLGYNYDKIDEFFVNSKDVWYLLEYISGVEQIDKDKIIDMILNLKDNEYITKILNDNIVENELNKEQLDRLKKGLEER